MFAFNNLKLGVKLPLMLAAVAITGLGIMGGMSFRDARAVLDESGTATLQNTLATRKYDIETWSRGLLVDARSEAASLATQRALREFAGAWGRIEGNPTAWVETTYGSGTGAPAGERDALDYAGDLSDYSIVHRRYHATLRALRDAKGFYDVFLIDVAGNVLYSVEKEADYGSNLLTGLGADTNLGQIVAKVLADAAVRPIASDFAAYAPSNGEPAAFIAAPVHSPEGQLLGAIAFQVATDRIEAMLRRAAGLGNTGQVYLVGQDGILRSNLRLSTEPALLVRKMENEAAARAIAGETGILEAPGMGKSPA